MGDSGDNRVFRMESQYLAKQGEKMSNILTGVGSLTHSTSFRQKGQTSLSRDSKESLVLC